MSDKKVLITGGAGYLGTVLAEYLLERSYQVTVLDNLMYKQLSLLHLFKYKNFEFVKADVRDKTLLQSLVAKHDIIIPLAAIVGMPACNENPDLAVAVNHTQIVDIVSELSTEQIIIMPNTNSQYGSSTEIITEQSEFKPLSLYAKTKCDAEDCVIEAGGVALRLATVFGTSARMRQDLLVNDFVYRAYTDGYLVLFESHYKRNYIHIQDIARTFEHIVNNYHSVQSEAFNVGLSDANLSKMELASKIKNHIPELVICQEEFKKDFDQRNYIVSNQKLESTGWYPMYDLDYGIKQLLGAYQLIVPHNHRNFTNL